MEGPVRIGVVVSLDILVLFSVRRHITDG